MNEHYHRIKQQYQHGGPDSTALFETLLSAARQIGLDEALACLEQCVLEKRRLWLQENSWKFETTSDPVMDGYRLFYEHYLGLSTPQDGEIVEKTPEKIVTRWWNPCPTLEACLKFGLDTREVCRKAYHQPVQVVLSSIHPRLKFDRNYEAIRPHAAFCEEIITLQD